MLKKISRSNKILLLIAVVFSLLAIYGLRNNYKTMTELRSAVEVADKDNNNVESALRDLREYVYSHMNTNLSSGKNAIKPPIQLKYTYERLKAEEAQRVKTHNTTVTKTAEAICASQFPAGGYNPPRVSCIQDYVAKNSITEDSVSESLYKFDFISPKWSPDLAGYSILIVIGSLVLVLINGTKNIIIKRLF